jgi:hypothetical protein
MTALKNEEFTLQRVIFTNYSSHLYPKCGIFPAIPLK